IFPDGSVVIDGDLAVIDGSPVPGFAKLLPDGKLDRSFEAGLGFNGEIESVIFDNGKLLVAGNFSMYNDTLVNNIVRLNSNGSIDKSLDTGKGVTGRLDDIRVQPDGKIVVVGRFTAYNKKEVSHIFRINEDGSFDESFVPDL